MSKKSLFQSFDVTEDGNIYIVTFNPYFKEFGKNVKSNLIHFNTKTNTYSSTITLNGPFIDLVSYSNQLVLLKYGEDAVVFHNGTETIKEEKIDCKSNSLFKITKLKNELYACGMSGIVCKRKENNSWEILNNAYKHNEEALEKAIETGNEKDLQYYLDNKGVNANFIRSKIIGNKIYFIGKTEGLFEAKKNQLKLIDKTINYTGDIVKVNNDLYVSTNKSTKGNAIYKILPDNNIEEIISNIKPPISKMIEFNGRVFCMHNETEHKHKIFEWLDNEIIPIEIKQIPEIESINDVMIYNNTLWILEDKSIVKFNGEKWKRINLIDNKTE